MATLRELFFDLLEARKKTPASIGPIDAAGKPVKLPDPIGISDAGTFVSSTQPGFTTKDTSRKGRYTDFGAMDTGDVASLLNAVVESALKFEDGGKQCFRLDGTKANALTILEQTIDFTKLRQKVRLIARDVLKYGDGFMEKLTDKDGVLLRVQTYYPAQIFVSTDPKGNLEKYTQINFSNQAVGEWTPDLMTHFKWEDSDREPYSVSGMLDPMRTDWANLQRLENGMILGRTSRAYPRNLHFIDVTNKTTVDAQKSVIGYIRAITQQNPTRNIDGFNAVTRTDLQPNEDIFIPTGYVQGQDGRLEKRLHDVKLLDPSLDGLSNINDVEYVRRKLFATVPSEIVGIGGKDLDTAAQYRAYARTVKHLQEVLETGLREVFTQALVLAGIAPDTLVFIWPNVVSGENWKFQDAQYKQAQTEQLEIENKTASRLEILTERKGKTLEEANAILAQIEEESQRFGAIAAPQSRTAQSAAGDKAGNSTATPDVTDDPNTPKNRDAQLKGGPGA